MNREQYIETREKMGQGQVDDTVMRLFFEYWLTFKKEEYENIDYDKFCDTFGVYLGNGFNYNGAINRVIKYYDQLKKIKQENIN